MLPNTGETERHAGDIHRNARAKARKAGVPALAPGAPLAAPPASVERHVGDDVVHQEKQVPDTTAVISSGASPNRKITGQIMVNDAYDASRRSSLSEAKRTKPAAS